MQSSESLNFSHLTQSHIANLKDAFQLIDEDGDGILSQADLNKTFRSIGKQLSEQQLKAMLPIKDSDDESGVTFPEFLSLMSENVDNLPEESEIIDCLKTLSDNDELQVPVIKLITYLKEAGFQDPEKEFARLMKEFSVENQITNEKVFKGKHFMNTISE